MSVQCEWGIGVFDYFLIHHFVVETKINYLPFNFPENWDKKETFLGELAGSSYTAEIKHRGNIFKKTLADSII